MAPAIFMFGPAIAARARGGMPVIVCRQSVQDMGSAGLP